ncbi:MAG: hypothetical protein CSA20_07410 [Deltaproteobacteria bacterium]|nr:MAG: hypothetical protein CSA20_07410 [Deltaproteobacteria bacterium]
MEPPFQPATASAERNSRRSSSNCGKSISKSPPQQKTYAPDKEIFLSLSTSRGIEQRFRREKVAFARLKKTEGLHLQTNMA